jgi:membrane protein DedA with SNARE-associated domain
MTDLFLTHGSYLSIFLVLVLTGSGLPIPEEIPIATAGILSAVGNLNPWLAFVSCLLGAIIGDCVMYVIGYHFGRSVLREHPWFARFVTPEREIQIEQQFRLHGLKVFFVARFLVGLRSPVYLTAGILRVSFRRFFLIDLFCASIVVGTFFLLAYLFGETVVNWAKRAELGFTIAVVLALIGVGIYFWWWHKKKALVMKDNPCNELTLDCTKPDPPSPPSHKNSNSAILPLHADKAGK